MYWFERPWAQVLFAITAIPIFIGLGLLVLGPIIWTDMPEWAKALYVWQVFFN